MLLYRPGLRNVNTTTGLRTLSRVLEQPLPADVRARLSRVPGALLDRSGTSVQFDARHTPDTAALALNLAQRAPLAVTFDGLGSRVEVTDADLAAINAHSHVELAREDVAVFEDYVASTGPISRPIRFTRKALERFAECYRAGRTLLLHHDPRRPMGHTFAADVVEATVRGVEGTWCRVRSYGVLKDASEKRRQAIVDAQTGVLRYVSIGFSGGAWEFVETDDGYVFIVTDDESLTARERLQADELSRVYLGATDGAGDGLARFSKAKPGPAPAPSTAPRTERSAGGSARPDLIIHR